MHSLVLAGKATLSVTLLTLLLAIVIHICVMLLNAALPDAVLGIETGAERPNIYLTTISSASEGDHNAGTKEEDSNPRAVLTR